MVGSKARAGVREWSKNAGTFIEIQTVNGPRFLPVNSRAGIEAQDEMLRRINLEHTAQVGRKVRLAFDDKIERKGTASSGGDNIEKALTETDNAGTRFPKDSEPPESLAHLDAKQSFRDLSCDLAGATIAFARRKVSGRFERDMTTQVESKSSTRSGMGLRITKHQGREVHADFIFRQFI